MKPDIFNITEIDDLAWTEPYQVSGGKYTLKSAKPTEAFWKLYREYKEKLKEAGIKVGQFKGEWQVNWWMNGGEFCYPDLPNMAERYSVEPEAPVAPLVLEPLVNETGFMPWQPALVQHLVAVMKRAGEADYACELDACGTGVGKTFITLGVIRERNQKALIICPKVLTLKWQRTAFKMGVECVGAFGWEWIKTGKTPFGHWLPDLDRKGKLRNKKGTFIWTVPDGVDLVFDECHRASGMDTQNAKIVLAAKMQRVPTHLLSATVADTPVKMRAPGFALGLHNDGHDFYSWMTRHGVRQDEIRVGQRTVTVYKFQGTKEQLQRIHATVFPHKGIRVRPEDIEDFPKNQIVADPYEIEEHKEITKAYEEMQERIWEIEADKDMENKQANILVEMLRARQRVELLKIPLMVSLTRDSMEEGNSVIIAVNFKETLKRLMEDLKITSFICGVSTGKFLRPDYTEFVRQDAVDDFQANKTRIIAGITAAMREGLDLHDEHGGHPRETLISPPQSSFFLKQVIGRGCRANGKSPGLCRILFAANTIEEKVCEGLASKLDRLDLLMDGDLQEGIFPAGYSDMRPEE